MKFWLSRVHFIFLRLNDDDEDDDDDRLKLPLPENCSLLQMKLTVDIHPLEFHPLYVTYTSYISKRNVASDKYFSVYMICDLYVLNSLPIQKLCCLGTLP